MSKHNFVIEIELHGEMVVLEQTLPFPSNLDARDVMQRRHFIGGMVTRIAQCGMLIVTDDEAVAIPVHRIKRVSAKLPNAARLVV